MQGELVLVSAKLFQQPQLVQILGPKRVPFFWTAGRRHMQLPVHANALFTAMRAVERLGVLASALQLAAIQASEGPIAHDATVSSFAGRQRPLSCKFGGARDCPVLAVGRRERLACNLGGALLRGPCPGGC